MADSLAKANIKAIKFYGCIEMSDRWHWLLLLQHYDDSIWWQAMSTERNPTPELFLFGFESAIYSHKMHSQGATKKFIDANFARWGCALARDKGGLHFIAIEYTKDGASLCPMN